jgi:hypothetical protein
MSTAMTLFTNSSVVPDHILALQDEATNIASRDSAPSLTFRGKVWRMVAEDEETILVKDGDPIASVEVVVLDQATGRGRAYYEGQYKEGENRAPTCASTDGVRPDSDIRTPQASSCSACPRAAKGSSSTGKGAACSSFKNLAVCAGDVLSPQAAPLRLRLAQTSVWDANNSAEEAKGWYAYDQYISQLRARGVTSTANRPSSSATSASSGVMAEP